MDRLSPLALLAPLLLAACGQATTTAPPPSRVDAVVAPPRGQADLDAFCEVHPDPETAPTFVWPPLDGAAPPMTGGWTWVNVWATWCGPCVEELPRISQWPEKLAAQGAPVTLRLLSADDSPGPVLGFQKSHAWAPPTLRVGEGADLPTWAGSMGLPEVLPLHLFVDPQGKLRCGRSGALSNQDQDTVRRLISGG